MTQLASADPNRPELTTKPQPNGFAKNDWGPDRSRQNVEPKKNVGAMAKAYFAHLEVKAAALDQGLPAPTQAWRAKTKKRNYRLQLRRWELHLEDHCPTTWTNTLLRDVKKKLKILPFSANFPSFRRF
jgi:hypothetical protein